MRDYETVSNKKQREIMKRFQIKNKAMKCKSKTDLIECKKHHNIVVQLNKCCKKEVFDSLEKKNKAKAFWSTVVITVREF